MKYELDTKTALTALVSGTLAVPTDLSDFIVPGVSQQGDESCRKTLFVIIGDESGSMAPYFGQLSRTGLAVGDTASSKPNVDVVAILFSSYARSGTLDLFQSKFVGGGTSFCAAFVELDRVLRSKLDTMPHDTRVVIVFMSDGQDYQGYTSAKTFHASIKRGDYGNDVTVHAVAFSRGHDAKLMDEIRTPVSGLYLYADPSDDDGLFQIMTEVCDFAMSPAQSLKVTVTIPGHDTHALDAETTPDGIFVSGSVVRRAGEPPVDDTVRATFTLSHAKVKMPSCVTTGLDITIVSNDLETEEGAAFFMSTVGSQISAMIDEHMGRVNTHVSNVYVLDALIATTAAKSQELRAKLEQVKKTLMPSPACSSFPRLKTRAERHALLDASVRAFDEEAWAAHVGRLDAFDALVPQSKKPELCELTKARMMSLKFKGAFVKKRREKLMDRRSAASAELLGRNHAELAKLVPVQIIEAEIPDADDREMYECDISGVTVEELLCEPADGDADLRKDVLGVAFYIIERTEMTVDDPTKLRFGPVSASLLSMLAYFDAVLFRSNIDGPLATHGGFSGAVPGSEPWATTDRSRGKVNAFLPAYLCLSHWERTKRLLPEALAYFCTLDPTAFALSQYHVVFTLLGVMVSRISEKQLPGERAWKIIEIWRETATHVMTDLFPQAAVVLRNFMEKPECRGPDAFSNVLTLVGYAIAFSAAPAEFQAEHGGPICPDTLLRFLRVEQLRRASQQAFLRIEREGKAPAESKIQGLLVHLLDPRAKVPRASDLPGILAKVKDFDPAPAPSENDPTDDDIHAATASYANAVADGEDDADIATACILSSVTETTAGDTKKLSLSFPAPSAPSTDAAASRAIPTTGNLAATIAFGNAVLPTQYYAYHPCVHAYMVALKDGGSSSPAAATFARFKDSLGDRWSGNHGPAGAGASDEEEAAAAAVAIVFRRNDALRSHGTGDTPAFPAVFTLAGGSASGFLTEGIADKLNASMTAAAKHAAVLAERRRYALRALHATSEAAFVLAFTKAFSTQDTLFGRFVAALGNADATIPLRREKIQLLHLNNIVLANDGTKVHFFNGGNVWMPGPSLKKMFGKVLGDNVYRDVIRIALAQAGRYTYRDSADYNRHGHGNYNPSLWALKSGVPPTNAELARWKAIVAEENKVASTTPVWERAWKRMTLD